MRSFRSVLRHALPAAVVAIIAAGLGVATGAIPEGNKLHSCINTTTYGANVRVVDHALPAGDPRQSCKAGETAYDITNATGPAGPTGSVGPAGPAGPSDAFHGAAAPVAPLAPAPAWTTVAVSASPLPAGPFVINAKASLTITVGGGRNAACRILFPDGSINGVELDRSSTFWAPGNTAGTVTNATEGVYNGPVGAGGVQLQCQGDVAGASGDVTAQQAQITAVKVETVTG